MLRRHLSLLEFNTVFSTVHLCSVTVLKRMCRWLPSSQFHSCVVVLVVFNRRGSCCVSLSVGGCMTAYPVSVTCRWMVCPLIQITQICCTRFEKLQQRRKTRAVWVLVWVQHFQYCILRMQYFSIFSTDRMTVTPLNRYKQVLVKFLCVPCDLFVSACLTGSHSLN